MRVLITGTSSGIGKATALKFMRAGIDVIGIDIKPSPASLEKQSKLKGAVPNAGSYEHIIADVSKLDQLPEIKDIDFIVNNAGTVDEDTAIAVNLEGYINVAEKYGFQEGVKSVLNVCSISAHLGHDLPRYSASQGGRLAYTRNLARRLGKLGVRVNSVSPGATLSGLEPYLYEHQELLDKIAEESVLKKWMKPEEVAEWIYFITVIDQSMHGQDVIIDNGECSKHNWVSLEDL